MPRVETQGSENEEESKQRCVTYEFIVLDNFNFPPTAAKPSFAPCARNAFNSRRPQHHASIDTRGNNGSLWRHNS